MDFKRIGLILALSWIIVGLIIVKIGIPHEFAIIAGLSLLFLLLAIFIAIRNHYKEDGRTLFLDDVKAAMRQAAVFTLLVSGFTFVYFKFINPEVIEEKIEQDMAASIRDIKNAGGWDEYVRIQTENSPGILEKSEADYLDDLRERKETMISAGSAFLGSLVSLLSISFIYSLLVTLFYRKILVRFE